MSDADWVIKQGDLAPAFEDTLTLENGTVPPLAGAALQFVMRSLTATAPVAISGTAAIVNTATGAVKFTPTATDTDTAGRYQAVWRVTLADGTPMTFPTVGYLSVVIEENLAVAGQDLVSLPDVKEYLNIAGGDRLLDAKLTRFIRAARPVIENIAGPIIPALFDERHAGGGTAIQVRRRPSTAPGTSPILELLTITEFLGSTSHDLVIADDPSEATTYSCMIDRIGTITRRSGGGGVTAFQGDVHITYRAGQAVIPANVHEATLELLRVNYQTTRPAGVGRRTVADEQDTGAPLGFYVPKRVRELLAPNRRAPSVA